MPKDEYAIGPYTGYLLKKVKKMQTIACLKDSRKLYKCQLLADENKVLRMQAEVHKKQRDQIEEDIASVEKEVDKLKRQNYALKDTILNMAILIKGE